MSQFTSPWSPREPRAYGGLRGLIVKVAVPTYHIGARILRFPFVALSLFCGTLVAIALVAWAHMLLFTLVDGWLTDDAINLATQTGALGAELRISELRDAVVRDAGWGLGLSELAAYPLWLLQFKLIRDLIGLGAVVGFISIVPAFVIWWERKVAGRIQSRLGPMRVGGWHGWSQSVADGIKLVGKEDLIPAGADRALFIAAPYFAMIASICAFIALPFGTLWVFRELDVALIFILAMIGIEVVGVILAGWASNNKWSVYGAMREACQMVSYEIPMGMSLLIPIMCAGTLSLTGVADGTTGWAGQDGGWFSWLAFRNPFTFAAFGCYYIASLASCKRAPFDLPESESELVAGFHTEYSGFRFAMFFFAEYASMFVMSGLAVILFLGAWHSPLPAGWGASLADGGLAQQALHGILFNGPLWFIGKTFALVYVQIWLRWTLPRIRIDQVLYACVQVLLPLTMLLLLGNTLWEIAVVKSSTFASVSWALGGLCGVIGLAVTAGAFGIMAYGWTQRWRMVGRLAVKAMPGS